MTTHFYTDPVFEQHDTGPDHPENMARLQIIRQSMNQRFGENPAENKLIYKKPTAATYQDLLLVHTQGHIDHVFQKLPQKNRRRFDGDTIVSPESGMAALHAVGAVLDATKSVLHGKAKNAFCAVRPPGHHALRNSSHGFCLFNAVAIGAKAAKKYYGCDRVAIIDFDVHHGDGTQDAVQNDSNIFFASTHQAGIFPFTGMAYDRGPHNTVLNIPVPAGTNGDELKKVMGHILDRIKDFKPDIIFVSAGFDAHKEDPLANLMLKDKDFADIMRLILDTANEVCKGRVVATLEGGYNGPALGRSVVATVAEMVKYGPR